LTPAIACHTVSVMNPDAALDALFLPLREGHVACPPGSEILFLGARAGAALNAWKTRSLRCVQTFKPSFNALIREGFAVAAEVNAESRYPLVLLLPARNRDLARAEFARALDHLAEGGVLIAAQANSEGARSSELDLSQLAGALTVISKHKCRVFWTRPFEARNEALIAQWRERDAPRAILADRMLSRPGVFAWDRIDAASALLAEHLPTDLAGDAADLGAGWGYLSHAVLTRNPGIRRLDAYEADARALELVRHNLASFADRVTLGWHWADVTQGLTSRYHVIVCNPPFHTQQASARPDIGRGFIRAAADALHPGGRLWLVANRQLPYESVLGERFAERRVHAQETGFKVIEAIKQGSRA